LIVSILGLPSKPISSEMDVHALGGQVFAISTRLAITKDLGPHIPHSRVSHRPYSCEAPYGRRRGKVFVRHSTPIYRTFLLNSLKPFLKKERKIQVKPETKTNQSATFLFCHHYDI